MADLDAVLMEAARGVRCAGLHACEANREPGSRLAPWHELPYVVKVGVSGDHAEAEDLPGALAAAYALVDDALPASGFDRRACRLSVTVTFNGKYDGIATRMAQKGRAQR